MQAFIAFAVRKFGSLKEISYLRSQNNDIVEKIGA